MSVVRFTTSLGLPVIFFLNIYANSSVRTLWSCLIKETLKPLNRKEQRSRQTSLSHGKLLTDILSSWEVNSFSETFQRTLKSSCIHEHAPHRSCVHPSCEKCKHISPEDTQTRYVTGLTPLWGKTRRKQKVSWCPANASKSTQPLRPATRFGIPAQRNAVSWHMQLHPRTTPTNIHG